MIQKKYFFFVFFLFLAAGISAQAPFDYSARWKIIDTLILKKGLTESALKEVNILYVNAKKEKNDAQLIKALLYKMQLQNQKEENAEIKNITLLEKEIVNTSEPARSILNSILADAYLNYFNQNRYRYYNRTSTSGFKQDDPATWSSEDFHRRIGFLYLKSIEHDKQLQQTKLAPFDPIILKGNVRYLRPTLFDLLAHRALEYFKNDEQDIRKPASVFELEDSLVFAPAEIFAMHSFVSNDSLSLHLKALHLFQQLILFHEKDPSPAPLIDVDNERIEFANSYGVMENKNDLYLQALTRISNHYRNVPAAAQASFLLAQDLATKAGQYDPITDTVNRYAYVQAKLICEKILQQKDSSEGKSNAGNLMKSMLYKTFQLQTEKVNLPEQPFRMLVNYRNFTELYLHIIPINQTQKENLGNNAYEDAYWSKLLSLPAGRSISQTFPDPKDHQQHAAEMKIDALPAGSYAIVASTDKTFSLGNNPMAVVYFQVSAISFINKGNDYFILDRDSGKPLVQAAVQVWNKTYDNKKAKNILIKAETYSTDLHGYFKLAKPKPNTSILQNLEIKYQSDHLFTDEQDRIYYRNEDETEETVTRAEYEKNSLKTFFFTDRSIYRPGQTIFFKAIVLTKDFDTRQSKIISGFKSKVFLYNANDEKIDSLLLTTNDYGSFHGKFRLPAQGLNGEFRLEEDSSGVQQSFSVEEYKRPKFQVEFETLKGAFRVNDSVAVTGNAKAYAGNNLDGATVKYRVTRQARFLYPMYRPGKRFPQVAAQEIAHGELKTGTDGKFAIHFKAVPDKNIQQSDDAIFDYQVIADITDLNGETRSGETTVHIGYKAMQINISLPLGETLPADSLKYLFIKSTNISGEYEPAKLHVEIFRLHAPDRLIRTRYWKQPDQFLLTKEEYRKYFPLDEYSDELEKENWTKDAKLFDKTDSARKNSTFDLAPTSFKPGWHKIEVSSKDKFGNVVNTSTFLQLTDNKTGSPASPQNNWTFENSHIQEPGSTAILNIGSSAENVFVIQQVDKTKNESTSKQDSNSQYHFLELSNEKKSIPLPIAETDRGGFGVSFAFVKNNRFYSSENIVSVPWTNKDLSISYETFRDKTLPGSQEKWKVKVSGYKKDKVVAEVLTSMYDASLDQFKMQNWEKPGIYDEYLIKSSWTNSANFSSIQSENRSFDNPSGNFYVKTYDNLGMNDNQNVMAALSNLGNPGSRTKQMKIDNFIDRNKAPQNEIYTNSGDLMLKGRANPGENDAIYVNLEIPKYNFKTDTILFKPVSNSPHPAIQVRKNFSETAFFFPDLKTDSSGNLEFSFTMPESVTEWKWMTLAHTKDLAFGYSEKSIVTQKKLMVQPNPPRFLREGDRMEFSAKIVNLTDSEMTGQAFLTLTDPENNETADGIFSNRSPMQYFTAAAGQSTVVNFNIEVPYQYAKPVTYRVTASTQTSPTGGGKEGAGALAGVSDGEEATLPVIGNRTLVTESLPLNIRSAGTKKFRFEKLLQSGSSETLQQHALTVEFTANPAWYAVQALPYLTEYPYECAEQSFNRFYANALAAKIANSSPRIKQWIEKLNTSVDSASKDMLLSNLEKNPELKNVLLEETPWVLDAKNETQQKKNIALLFDMMRMNSALGASLQKFQEMQSPGGGFAWFNGGPDDRYITQYILSGIGHLQKLHAIPDAYAEKLEAIVKAAIPYVDKKILEDYEQLKKRNKILPVTNQLSNLQVQYLYLRSFFSAYAIPGKVFPAVNYYRKQSQQFWLQQNNYLKGMIALSLFRTGDIQKAKDILASLKQNAITNEEMSMYWKDVHAGYYWYQAPVETQSLLIEAFSEILHDTKTTDNLKTWLLKQKQTQNWSTTKATADACYALLLQGSDWLNEQYRVDVKLGTTAITSPPAEGPGYFKKTIEPPFIKPDMGNLAVTLASPTGVPDKSGMAGAAWGSIYWQYFEDMDKITPAATPLSLKRKLFVEKNTDRGPVLEPVPANGFLHVGDKVKVRIELRVDRDMEYVHMKDLRASCMEPVNVLSAYKWQDGLGYYESTKDVSTGFFFNWLPKGTYVFEYPMFVTASGNFSNGITTIQCMYAPEFNAHSEGIRVNVEN